MLECQDIHLSLADFINDLAAIEEEFAGMRPLSAVHDTLKEQEREFKVRHLGIHVLKLGLWSYIFTTKQFKNRLLSLLFFF